MSELTAFGTGAIDNGGPARKTWKRGLDVFIVLSQIWFTVALLSPSGKSRNRDTDGLALLSLPLDGLPFTTR